MGCATNHAIYVGLLNVKVNIKSVHHVQVGAFSEDIVNHLDVVISFLLVFCSVPTYLYSCRVKWCILILITAHQDDVLEPFETLLLRQLV